MISTKMHIFCFLLLALSLATLQTGSILRFCLFFRLPHSWLVSRPLSRMERYQTFLQCPQNTLSTHWEIYSCAKKYVFSAKRSLHGHIFPVFVDLQNKWMILSVFLQNHRRNSAQQLSQQLYQSEVEMALKCEL